MRVQVELDAPAILVLGDAYAQGWKATPMRGSSQQDYTVMRANAVLRAVPLGAGRHLFELVYAPDAYRAGLWSSA